MNARTERLDETEAKVYGFASNMYGARPDSNLLNISHGLNTTENSLLNKSNAKREALSREEHSRGGQGTILTEKYDSLIDDSLLKVRSKQVSMQARGGVS